MNNRQKIAITNVIRAAENPERYGLKTANTQEQNKAICKALKTLFVFEGDMVKDFNEETIEAFFRLTERPSIDIL
ncbi:MAG: hypothetical protein VZQ61_06980 [Christensenellaceae bacterium]